jgi:hypothetical protein
VTYIHNNKAKQNDEELFISSFPVPIVTDSIREREPTIPCSIFKKEYLNHIPSVPNPVRNPETNTASYLISPYS